MPDENPSPRSGEQRGDKMIQRALIGFLLDEYPASHTQTTLWWMGLGDLEDVEEAIRTLGRFGLIRVERRSVALTDPARHFDWLELS